MLEGGVGEGVYVLGVPGEGRGLVLEGGGDFKFNPLL